MTDARRVTDFTRPTNVLQKREDRGAAQNPHRGRQQPEREPLRQRFVRRRKTVALAMRGLESCEDFAKIAKFANMLDSSLVM